ncbi:MAG: hypothetical protein AB1726_13420 [Planctomycetota bacterium]
MERRWFARFAAIAAGLALASAGAPAAAQTATLELKRLGASRSLGSFDFFATAMTAEDVAASVVPQSVGMPIREGEDTFLEYEFSEHVTREPEYVSEHPLRDSVRLGDHRYCLALDSRPGEEEYSVLYFDRDRNGDLTDDAVIEAKRHKSPGFLIFGGGDVGYEFPLVELEIVVEGRPMPYALGVVTRRHGEEETTYVSASLSAAVYREGEIAIAGRRHRLVLVDMNSNGRFDDRIPAEALEGEEDDAPLFLLGAGGDALLVDPEGARPWDLFDPASDLAGRCHPAGGRIVLDGAFHELAVSPTGAEVKITPYAGALGRLQNSMGPWRAWIRSGKDRFLVAAGSDGAATVPAGEWRLLSYTVDLTAQEAAKAGPPPKRSFLSSLGALFGGEPGPPTTLVSARAGKDVAPVRVGGGEEAALPFGPPYRGVVTAQRGRRAGGVRLSLQIVGAAGEVVSDLRVGGNRPKEPTFVITDPAGAVVKRGSFEYG